MSMREQTKYFEALRRYERKIKGREAEEYRELLMRHKDDEELDLESLARLMELYDKYYVHREKINPEDYFRKPEKKEQ